MAPANPAAMRGQAELNLGTFRPGRALCFSSTPSRRHFIDALGGRVYEARLILADGQICWRASIRLREDRVNFIACKTFTRLGDATNYLQDRAAEIGGSQ